MPLKITIPIMLNSSMARTALLPSHYRYVFSTFQITDKQLHVWNLTTLRDSMCYKVPYIRPWLLRILNLHWLRDVMCLSFGLQPTIFSMEEEDHMESHMASVDNLGQDWGYYFSWQFLKVGMSECATWIHVYAKGLWPPKDFGLIIYELPCPLIQKVAYHGHWRAMG